MCHLTKNNAELQGDIEDVKMFTQTALSFPVDIFEPVYGILWNVFFSFPRGINAHSERERERERDLQVKRS